MKTYKVWIHVEEIDEDEDFYEDLIDFLPIPLFESSDKEEAMNFALSVAGEQE